MTPGERQPTTSAVTRPHQVATTGPRPLVSVIIPVYNQGQFVAAAIESVLAQGYAPIELIVVDDGSTDDTADRLKHYEETATILRQPNRGAAAALNRGIRQSRGSLVCWLSADDEFLAGKLEAQVAAFLEAPEVGLVHTGYEVIDSNERVTETIRDPVGVSSDAFVTVFWKNTINGSTVMLRREVFDDTGGFDESLRADVDGDMWLRITQGHSIVGISGVFARYRVHGNTLSANTALMAESMTTVRRRHMNELKRRLRHRAMPTPAVLANMSAQFATQGLHALAVELLRASLHSGFAGRSQLIALARIALAHAKRQPVLRAVGLPLRQAWKRHRRR